MDWITNSVKSLTKTNQTKLNPPQSQDQPNLSNIYHEKQRKELCALHSLNNIFQENFYSKNRLDQLCVELSPQEWVNPHRSILGRGNYNINIIMKALQLKDHEAVWFDKRRSVSILNFTNIKGFILNVPSDFKFGGIVPLPWERKHWVAITKINDVFYNLDSKLEGPELIGSSEQLTNYLDNLLKSKDKELFVIVHKQVEVDQSWKV